MTKGRSRKGGEEAVSLFEGKWGHGAHPQSPLKTGKKKSFLAPIFEKKKEEKLMSKNQSSNVSLGSSTKVTQDHRANQTNPGSSAYKAVQDNRSNQLNPNHAPTKK